MANFRIRHIIMLAAAVLLTACAKTTADANEKPYANAPLPDMIEEIEEDSLSSTEFKAGIVGEAVLADGRKLTFLSGGKIVDWEIAVWEKVDKAIVIYTGEGTTFMSLIDGYSYWGDYRDGKCWNEEWDDTTESLEDVGYVPTPDKGEKLISFRWYESD